MDLSLLDPEIGTFVSRMTAAWASHPPIASLPYDAARAVAEEVRAPWRIGGPEMAVTKEVQVPVRGGTLRIRVYDPGVDAPAPALVYLHGGGFTFFSIETHDRLMREYAAEAGVLVVGVDYPLSPEARFPTALDQVEDLMDWLDSGNGAAMGVDPARIAIGGDSAGANIAVATALRLRDRGETARLRGLLLNYGGFSPVCSDAAEEQFGGEGAVLNRAEMDYYFDNYVGADGRAQPHPQAAPLLADVAGLPPALFIIPECDILSEQSHAMAAKMAEAGVEVRSIVYPGATHSFLEAMSVAEIARRAIADGAAWVKAIVA